LSQVFWYFAAAESFVFGSGVAIVPFLHGGVNHLHWLMVSFRQACMISLDLNC
jgi:hypothetical protein